MSRKYPKNAPVPNATEGLKSPILYSPSRVRKVIGWMFMPFVIILAIPFLLLVALPYQMYKGESIFDCGGL